jgi:hypothetical protein
MSKNYTGLPFVPISAMAVDLFPHTEDIETLILFQRVKKPEIPSIPPAVASTDSKPAEEKDIQEGKEEEKIVEEKAAIEKKEEEKQ